MSKVIPKQYLIIGDIIQSRKQASKKLWNHFNQVVSKINKKYDLMIPLCITLGDEYQGVCQTFSESKKIQKELRKMMKPYGLRTVVVPLLGDLNQKPIVKINNPLNTCEMLYAQEKIKSLKKTKKKIFEVDKISKSVRKNYQTILSLDYVTGKGLKNEST